MVVLVIIMKICLVVLFIVTFLWLIEKFFNIKMFDSWTWLKTEVASIGPVKKLLLVLFVIFSFVVVIWFINKMSKPIEANAKPAVKSVIKTVIDVGYATTESWDNAKMDHKRETGDYVPTPIMQAYSSSDKTITIKIDSSFRSVIDLTPFSKGKRSCDFNVPCKIIASKELETIRSIEPGTKNVPGFDGVGVWYFSAQEYFCQNPGAKSITMTLTFK